MITMLQRMDARLNDSGGLGFAKTHPSAASRAEALSGTITNTGSAANTTRQLRFATAMGPIVAGK
jgi:hypothetical protein